MKLKLNCAVYAILFLTAMAQTGCATFLNDDNQMVVFNTTPDGARVAIDGIAMGDTPVVLPVPRKGGDKLITFTKSGYKTVNYELQNTLNIALAGNIILGGGVGLIVDAISGRGGGYQKNVSIMLEPGSGTITTGSKDEKKKKEKTAKSKAPS